MTDEYESLRGHLGAYIVNAMRSLDAIAAPLLDETEWKSDAQLMGAPGWSMPVIAPKSPLHVVCIPMRKGNDFRQIAFTCKQATDPAEAELLIKQAINAESQK